jgi:hypothetical protein
MSGLPAGKRSRQRVNGGLGVVDRVARPKPRRGSTPLLLNGDEHVAGLVVKALLAGIVANLLDGVADDGLVVNHGAGGNLAKDQDHAGLGGRLCATIARQVRPRQSIKPGKRREGSMGRLEKNTKVGWVRGETR